MAFLLAGHSMATTAEEYKARLLELAEPDIVVGDDGFAVWWPAWGVRGGSLSAEALRIIADELDRRNATWAAELDRYFEEQNLKRQTITFVGLTPPDGQYGGSVERGSHYVSFVCPGPEGNDQTYGGTVPQPLDATRVDVNVVGGVGEVVEHQ